MIPYHERILRRVVLKKAGKFLATIPPDMSLTDEGNWVERSVRLSGLIATLSDVMSQAEAMDFVDHLTMTKRGFTIPRDVMREMGVVWGTIEFSRCWKWLYHFSYQDMVDHCELVRSRKVKVMSVREVADAAGFEIA